MAARYLFCLCWRAALPALPLVRPLYDPPDRENDGRETDTRKEVVYTDWAQVASFAREIAHLTDDARV